MVVVNWMAWIGTLVGIPQGELQPGQEVVASVRPEKIRIFDRCRR